MVGSEKCQALHSLIRIVVCTGVRKQCGRNFGSEVTKWLFVFFYIVQTRSMVLLFLSLQKLKQTNKKATKHMPGVEFQQNPSMFSYAKFSF